MWARFDNFTVKGLCRQYNSDYTNSFYFRLHESVGLQFVGYNSGSLIFVASQGSMSGWSANTWYHIAVVRNGSNVFIYRDGVQIATSSATGSLGNYYGSFMVGLDGYSNPMQGYLDEFRITKGLARWTSNFTPPTTPYSTAPQIQ